MHTSVLKAPDPPTISRVLPYYSASSRELVKIDVDVKSDPIVGLYHCSCIVYNNMHCMARVVLFLGKVQHIRRNRWINKHIYLQYQFLRLRFGMQWFTS
jgi:hypothetical protein